MPAEWEVSACWLGSQCLLAGKSALEDWEVLLQPFGPVANPSGLHHVGFPSSWASVISFGFLFVGHWRACKQETFDI